MSVNNLAEHLSWLLTSKAFVPSASTILHTVPADPAVAPQPTQAHDVDSEREHSSESIHWEEEGGRTEEEATAPAPDNANMARLRGTPSPAKKPKLLSHTSCTEPQFSRREASRYASVTPQRVFSEALSVHIKPVQDFHANPIDCKTPIQSFQKTPRSFFGSDIDTVDLTGDFSSNEAPCKVISVVPGQAGSETFLPNGRYATSPVAGRKRNSDEYFEDMSHTKPPRSKRIYPPNSVNVAGEGIPLVNDVINDPPPPYSTTAPKIHTPNLDEEEDSRYFSHSSRSQTALKEVMPSVALDQSTHPDRNMSPKSKLATSEKRTIADSDDEDAAFTQIEGCDKGAEDHEVELTTPEPNPTSSAIQSQSKRVPTPQFQDTPLGQSSIKSSPAVSQQIKGPAATPVLELDPNAEVCLEVFKDSPEAVVLLSKWNNRMLQQYLDQLTARNKSCAKRYVEALNDGDDIDPELEKERRSLITKVDAMKRLILARQQYGEKSERKRLITRQLGEIAEESMEIPADLMSENKRLRDALKQDATTLAQLVEQTGLSLSNVPCTPVTGNDKPQVAVHSTQMHPTGQNVSYNAQTSSYPQTQYVKQTQSHSSHATATVKSSGQQSNQHIITPPAMDNYIDQNGCNEPLNDGMFSDNMGEYHDIVFDGEDEENYCPEDDDEDMLQAVEHVEYVPSRRSPETPARKRRPLDEDSGNVQLPQSGNHSRVIPFKVKDNPELQHRWSADVIAAMKNRFHLTGFRLHQLEAINATLSGKDVFVLMPTGGGKSLCYQLPSIISSGKTTGVTVVVSPLVSLMEDQMNHLKRLNVQVFQYNSNTGTKQRDMIIDAFRKPQPEAFVQILYVTPEMLTKSTKLTDGFQHLYKKGRLARFVIDEAHCVSQWGHDFRPDYKMLGDLRQQFSGVPVMALTATATENVKMDTIYNLNMRGCVTLSQSFNRPNLFYEVRKKDRDVLNQIAGIINKNHRAQSGIIYCISRKKCEDVAKKLGEDHHIKAHHYHAMMSYEEKCDVQRRWQAGEYHVIVATIAFGMGIDKPDVRYVIHHGIPKSLEGYYQETGRAGRDGEKSNCYLFYGFQDVIVQRSFIDKAEDVSKEQQDRLQQMLRNVTQFCENKSDCRRVQILQYFNENFPKESCRGYCDNCNSNATFKNQDFTELASLAVKLVQQIVTRGEKVTLLHCVDVLRGSKTKRIRELEHADMDGFGHAANIDRNDVERIFYRLISENALQEKNKVNGRGFTNKYISLGRRANDFKQGKRSVSIQIRVSPNGKNATLMAPPEKALKPKSRNANTASSRSDQPLSTIIPTPKSGPTNLHLQQYRYDENDDDDEDDDENNAPAIRTNGQRYERDGFCVSDQLEPEAEPSSDDAFEPPPESPILNKKSRRRKKASLSDPITSNDQLDELTETHQMVVEDFVIRGKEKCRQILVDKGLRQAPFTDSMLRQMAIDFPKTVVEMRQIPGIDIDKVELYAKHFLPLILQAQEHYEQLLGNNQKPEDPNRETIIDLCDDEEDFVDQMVDEYYPSSQENEQSHYFNDANPHVAAFNAEFNEAVSAAPVSASTSNKKIKSSNNRNGHSQDPDSPGRVRKPKGGARSKRASSDSASRGASGFKKKRAGSKTAERNSSNSFPRQRSKKPSGRGGLRGGFSGMQRTITNGIGGIGMMPT